MLDGDQFPGRPDHPDFWRLSQTALYLDGEANESGKSIPEINAEIVDTASLIYMARGRIELLLEGSQGIRLSDLPFPFQATLLAVYMGAFAHGVVFQKEGGHQ